MSLAPEQIARRYGAFFETLTPAGVEGARALVTADMRFKDPFNDVRGVDRVVRLLAKMFEDAAEIRFKMLEIVGTDEVWFLHWEFSCRPRMMGGRTPWLIPGVSRITIDPASGLIAEHVDYWDAGEYLYERLPIVGRLIRLIKRPLSLKD